MEIVLLIILIVHWFADFVMQTDEQAKGKSKSVVPLTAHVLTYSCIWFCFILGWSEFNFENSLIFFLITFVSHWVTDFITSRVGKIFWDKGDTHNGFVVVGFDQILHYIQLYLTFKLLFL